MSTIINADTSDGLKFTSDTSGEIKLQSAGADIATVSSTGIAMAAGKTLPASALTGTLPAGTNVISAGTSVASTSGTSIDFTGIPSWVKRITVMFNGVSTNGSSSPLLQIGDSGGIENTGYSGMSGLSHSTGTNTYTGVTSGIPLGYSTMSATATYSGNIFIANVTGNIWSISGSLATTSLLYLMTFAGSKTLSATLDRVRITTVNGTDTFDAGSINILYE